MMKTGEQIDTATGVQRPERVRRSLIIHHASGGISGHSRKFWSGCAIPMVCLCILVQVHPAQAQVSQDETSALKATVEEQRKAIVALREWARDLDVRLKLVEEMKEVRVPRGIKNNLRILQAAVEQYCLEHGVIECRFSDLMGTYLSPTTFPTYDGEQYETLRLALDAGEWRIDTSLGISIVHKLPPFDPAAFERLQPRRQDGATGKSRPSNSSIPIVERHQRSVGSTGNE